MVSHIDILTAPQTRFTRGRLLSELIPPPVVGLDNRLRINRGIGAVPLELATFKQIEIVARALAHNNGEIPPEIQLSLPFIIRLFHMNLPADLLLNQGIEITDEKESSQLRYGNTSFVGQRNIQSDDTGILIQDYLESEQGNQLGRGQFYLTMHLFGPTRVDNGILFTTSRLELINHDLIRTNQPVFSASCTISNSVDKKRVYMTLPKFDTNGNLIDSRQYEFTFGGTRFYPGYGFQRNKQ